MWSEEAREKCVAMFSVPLHTHTHTYTTIRWIRLRFCRCTERETNIIVLLTVFGVCFDDSSNTRNCLEMRNSLSGIRNLHKVNESLTPINHHTMKLHGFNDWGTEIKQKKTLTLKTKKQIENQQRNAINDEHKKKEIMWQCLEVCTRKWKWCRQKGKKLTHYFIQGVLFFLVPPRKRNTKNHKYWEKSTSTGKEYVCQLGILFCRWLFLPLSECVI